MKATEDHGQKVEGGLVPSVGSKHELTREFYTRTRNGKKRPYVYNFARARACPHPSLKAMSIGGSTYRCEQCNYTFDIVAANMQPLHNRVLGDMLNMLHFAKEFGVGAFEEVLRTPIGQYDKSAQKPVLPDGVSMVQALLLMDEVDINAVDGGKAQLAALLNDVWVNDEERDRKAKQLAGQAVPGYGQTRGLDAGNSDERPKLKRGKRPPKVQALPEPEHAPVP